MNSEIVVHNFCESRLNNYDPPELFNAYSSLIISIYPLYLGFPENDILFNTAILFFINGITSFYYHYKLNYIGKQADEIAMIVSTYYGIWILLKIFLKQKKKVNFYNAINTFYMFSFTIVNLDTTFDFYFPFLFGGYLLGFLYLIARISTINNIFILKNIFISLLGGIFWVISELNCNEITQYGHIMWHILFPLGLYRIILSVDKSIKNSNLLDN